VGREAIDKLRVRKSVEREFEAAEQILIATYRAKGAVEGIRGNFVRAYELEEAEKALRAANEDFDSLIENQRKAYIDRGVIYKRAAFFKEDFDAVFEVLPAAEIYFGSGLAASVRKLVSARQKIFAAADMLPTLVDHPSEDESDKEFRRTVRRDLYGSFDPKAKDRVTALVEEAVSELEATLLPKLRAAASA